MSTRRSCICVPPAANWSTPRRRAPVPVAGCRPAEHASSSSLPSPHHQPFFLIRRAVRRPSFPPFPPPHFTRSTTFIVNPTNASLAGLSGSLSTNPLALPANLRARSTVLSSPSDLPTISRANSTSPGSSNLRRMSGPISGWDSHAKSAGAVARPNLRSAPAPGLPRSGEGRKSSASSMSWAWGQREQGLRKIESRMRRMRKLGMNRWYVDEYFWHG